MSPSQCLGAPIHADITLNFRTSCCNLKIRRLEENCVWLFSYFNFERSYEVLKSMYFVEQKQKISLCFSLYKNRELNVKLMSWGSRKKREGIFCTIHFVRRDLFKICVLSQCMLYLIYSIHSEYTCFYKSKNITSYTFVACF